ncbi:MAG: DUF1611 domain-containing protein [Sediminibacterium sp.]|nr:DUF1611 domain-containing protein [Sediminibacterium sp.]
MNNALILTNGLLTTSDAKTAHGLIRGTERFSIKGIIDQDETAGKDAGELLDGIYRNIPIYSNLQQAIAAEKNIQFLIIGVATVGGYLPPNMLVIIKEAIQQNISIVNGLHEYLIDNPSIVALAAQHHIELIDIRKPKQRKDLHFWKGDIYQIKATIIAVLGMDCAMGKRTTARMLKNACLDAGLQAEMIYTGQTGWLQGGKYGFIFDSTLNDFVSGELEHAIVSCVNETGADFLFLEGQSSLRNPSGPCGSELLISGNAKFTILVHAPKRMYFDDDPHWGEIPSVESEIALIEQLGSSVIALALNTQGCTNEEIYAYQQQYQERLGIPVLLPIQEGVTQLIDVLKQL